MSQPAKVILALILGLIAVGVVFTVVKALVSTLLGLLIPLAILGGIGYVVYVLVWKNNALGGGRRYLP